MKKNILPFLLLIISINLFAQENKSGQNEIKFNVPLAIFGLPELSYERIVEDNMTVGISVAIPAEKPYDYNTGKGISQRSIITPFYRLYFGEKRAAGFYIEGNMAVSSQKELNDYNYVTGLNVAETKSTGFGFGAAVGVKLLTKNGFTGDFYGGWGRLFGDNIYNGFPRLGICIGKRF